MKVYYFLRRSFPDLRQQITYSKSSYKMCSFSHSFLPNKIFCKRKRKLDQCCVHSLKTTAAAAAAESLQSCPTLPDPTHQTPPSLGFSRQEHWSGLPFPSPMHESEKWKWSCSVVPDSATPWTAAYQAPPSMGFSRQPSSNKKERRAMQRCRQCPAHSDYLSYPSILHLPLQSDCPKQCPIRICDFYSRQFF